MEEESDGNSFDAQWEAEAQAAHAKKRYKTEESQEDHRKKMSGCIGEGDVDGDVPPDIDNDNSNHHNGDDDYQRDEEDGVDMCPTTSFNGHQA